MRTLRRRARYGRCGAPVFGRHIVDLRRHIVDFFWQQRALAAAPSLGKRGLCLLSPSPHALPFPHRRPGSGLRVCVSLTPLVLDSARGSRLSRTLWRGCDPTATWHKKLSGSRHAPCPHPSLYREPCARPPTRPVAASGVVD